MGQSEEQSTASSHINWSGYITTSASGIIKHKEAARTTPFLIALPLLTIWFHLFCKGRFESAFLRLPLQDAVIKDTLERATEPDLNLKVYLEDAYIHPIFKGGEYRRPVIDEESDPVIVATKRNSRMGSKTGSSVSSLKLSSGR